MAAAIMTHHCEELLFRSSAAAVMCRAAAAHLVCESERLTGERVDLNNETHGSRLRRRRHHGTSHGSGALA